MATRLRLRNPFVRTFRLTPVRPDERLQLRQRTMPAELELSFADHTFKGVEHVGARLRGSVPAELVRPKLLEPVFDALGVDVAVAEPFEFAGNCESPASRKF